MPGCNTCLKRHSSVSNSNGLFIKCGVDNLYYKPGTDCSRWSDRDIEQYEKVVVHGEPIKVTEKDMRATEAEAAVKQIEDTFGFKVGDLVEAYVDGILLRGNILSLGFKDVICDNLADVPYGRWAATYEMLRKIDEPQNEETQRQDH
jgi:hypothetical protein